MRLSSYLLAFFIGIFLIIGCSDFLVEDISDEKVNLRAPFDGAILNETLTSFWWDTLEWVDEYTLEVVHPSYDSVEFISVLISQENNIYDIELSGGEYQWSVTAHNSAYEAYSDTFNLTIELDTIIDDIVPDAPELNSPIDNGTINGDIVNLTWDSADDAYIDIIQIYSDSLLENLEVEDVTTSESYNFTNFVYESYYWRVKSEDEAGNVSDYSEAWKFFTE